MSLARITAEEIRGEWEKLYIILTDLQQNEYKDSTDLIFLRNKFHPCAFPKNQEVRKKRKSEGMWVGNENSRRTTTAAVPPAILQACKVSFDYFWVIYTQPFGLIFVPCVFF